MLRNEDIESEEINVEVSGNWEQSVFNPLRHGWHPGYQFDGFSKINLIFQAI